MHEFRSSVSVEERWTPVLYALLRRWVDDNCEAEGCAGHDIRPSNTDEQWRGYDYVVEACALCGSSPIRVEFKADEQAQKTGNLFIETVSNDQTGRKGWACTSEADWFFYLVAPGHVYLFEGKTLRDAVAGWEKAYPRRASNNGRYRTLGILVPVAAAAELASHIEAL